MSGKYTYKEIDEMLKQRDALVAQGRREAEEEIAAMKGEDPAEAFAIYRAAQRAELEAEAKKLGVLPDHLEGARKVGMDVHEYVRYLDPVNLTNVEAIEAEAKAEREARKQAEHEVLVEKEKAELA